jgi:hypothetical protein
MSPPGANKKTTSGNVRQTRRSARNSGASDESVERNEDKAPTNDSNNEEEMLGEACVDTEATTLQEEGDSGTVATTNNTVAAVVATQNTVGVVHQVTPEQSLLKHEHDVGSLLSIDNCKELARRRAMEDLFSMFKFPPKDKDTILLYQIKMMEKLGYTALATHHWNFSHKIWPKLVSEITVGLRCRRSTITEALDKRVIGTVA